MKPKPKPRPPTQGARFSAFISKMFEPDEPENTTQESCKEPQENRDKKDA